MWVCCQLTTVAKCKHCQTFQQGTLITDASIKDGSPVTPTSVSRCNLQVYHTQMLSLSYTQNNLAPYKNVWAIGVRLQHSKSVQYGNIHRGRPHRDRAGWIKCRQKRTRGDRSDSMWTSVFTGGLPSFQLCYSGTTAFNISILMHSVTIIVTPYNVLAPLHVHHYGIVALWGSQLYCIT